MEAIYVFYEKYVHGFGTACVPGCHLCCTRNVTATSLEASHVLSAIPPFLRPSLLDAVKPAAETPLYRPALTTNRVAELCLAGRDIPEDDGVHAAGACPLVDAQGLCMVYERRPFACRAMLSRTQCGAARAAEMDPFLVTVNLALYQVLEHLDRAGVSGNLLDLLAVLMEGDARAPLAAHAHLVPNRALPGFVVSPDERGRFGAFLRRLARTPAGDGTEVGAHVPLV